MDSPENASAHLLVRISPRDVAMFRFLLEGYDNLALFTVLQKRPAILKLTFARESRQQVCLALRDIGRSLAIQVTRYPE